jgi:hypothetical protein
MAEILGNGLTLIKTAMTSDAIITPDKMIAIGLLTGTENMHSRTSTDIIDRPTNTIITVMKRDTVTTIGTNRSIKHSLSECRPSNRDGRLQLNQKAGGKLN